MDFDRNQVKEFIGRVEDDIAQFIGAEFCAARIIANVSKQRELGDLSDAAARQLLDDAYHLAKLASIGHRYAKWSRRPPAELEILVLSGQDKDHAPHTR